MKPEGWRDRRVDHRDLERWLVRTETASEMRGSGEVGSEGSDGGEETVVKRVTETERVESGLGFRVGWRIRLINELDILRIEVVVFQLSKCLYNFVLFFF